MNGGKGPVYLEVAEQIAEETVTVQHPFQLTGEIELHTVNPQA